MEVSPECKGQADFTEMGGGMFDWSKKCNVTLNEGTRCNPFGKMVVPYFSHDPDFPASDSKCVWNNINTEIIPECRGKKDFANENTVEKIQAWIDHCNGKVPIPPPPPPPEPSFFEKYQKQLMYGGIGVAALIVLMIVISAFR
jgi:hypothetical protein